MALAAVVLEVERVAAGDAKLGHRRGREHEDGGVLDLAHRGHAATGDRLGTEFRIGALAPVLELDEGHAGVLAHAREAERSEEHTSELQSLMRISYAVFCLTKKTHHDIKHTTHHTASTIKTII